jgi:hypothetical protein
LISKNVAGDEKPGNHEEHVDPDVAHAGNWKAGPLASSPTTASTADGAQALKLGNE